MIKKIAFSLSMLLLAQLLVGAVPAFANSGAEWTFMVYMDADNSLDTACLDDISEMQVVGSTDEVNIVVMLDRYSKICGFNGTEILYVHKGYNETVWGSWTDEYELNMGDPETLTFFINYSVEHYHAEKYALILWDHGGNWEGVCWDSTDNDHLAVEEVSEALANSVIEDVDILGFDACLMGSIEVAYTMNLSGKVGIMVASEDFIPWDGWPYDMILADLVENPSWSEREFSTDIVDKYIDSYANVPVCKVFATLSAIDLAYIGDAVSYTAALTDELLASFDDYKDTITGAKNGADRYWFGMWHQGAYIDMHQFVYRLGTIEEDLKPCTDPILEIWDNAVIHSKCCAGPHIRSCAGLTIYFPRNRNLFYTPEPYCRSLPEFAEETRWYDLLTTYFG
jgi:hypothetical protein